jgi:hypothetical protein
MAEERELATIGPTEVANGKPTEQAPIAEQVENYVGVPMTPFLLDYLKSANGHQLANRTLEFLESLKKATLDEQAKAKAQQNELAKLALKHTVLIQTIGLFAVVGAIVGLSASGQLRGEAATILGAMAGYLFAQQKKAEV